RDIALDLQLAIGQQLVVSMEALRQVVINLAGNAVQAMAETGGTLSARSCLEHGWLLVEIADTGPGIPPAVMDKIFEPFFTTKEVGEGTGLGLSVSHALAEQMGGTLQARNRAEGGAIFTLRIPLSRSEE
ncbi:MAG TPA: ATP-binding protein, partial [Desulfuromonadales bacterium]|nr:ATP-binding protein [Desulfuromonadales bacterium]